MKKNSKSVSMIIPILISIGNIPEIKVFLKDVLSEALKHLSLQPQTPSGPSAQGPAEHC
jgi:hypothetical protein